MPNCAQRPGELLHVVLCWDSDGLILGTIDVDGFEVDDGGLNVVWGGADGLILWTIDVGFEVDDGCLNVVWGGAEVILSRKTLSSSAPVI